LLNFQAKNDIMSAKNRVKENTEYRRQKKEKIKKVKSLIKTRIHVNLRLSAFICGFTLMLFEKTKPI